MDKKNGSFLARFRGWFQAGAALLTNIHLPNFAKGVLYQGKGKTVCVPGLNCYSCPGAAGACPIGSFQAVVGSSKFRFSYYITGILILLGVLLGRFICGFLCPFGLIQDLLHKIPFPKKIRTFRGDKLLRKLKYVIFAVFVILLPLFLVDVLGQMYLQNAGAPTPSCHQKYTGKRSTKITATAYFSRLSFCVKAFLRSLGEGILYNKSCTSPKGHSQPQMTRPKQSANKRISPTT